MTRKKLNLDKINKTAIIDKRHLVCEAEDRYSAQIDDISKEILERGHNILLLSGPSASGKTTTAKRIRALLAKQGHTVHIISTDDFFKHKCDTPTLPDGRPDWETVDTVDIALLTHCIRSLSMGVETSMPVFDFSVSDRIDDSYLLRIDEGDAVIIEGIHALNPLITDRLPGDMTYNIYADVATEFDEVSWRDIRFIRRLIRDEKFRSFPPQGTARAWVSVIEAEEHFVLPFAKNADSVVDTSLSYELCFNRDEALRVLGELKNTEFEQRAGELSEIISHLEKIDENYVPKNSVLREFYGGLDI